MTTDYHGLGRYQSPFDARDYNVKDYIPKGALRKIIEESNWSFPGDPLDQGDSSHCVGFSMADFGINSPVNTQYTNEDGHAFYYKCKVIDEQPNTENGSTIRSAAKVLRVEGRIENYAFAPDMATIKWWLLNQSPMIVGTMWTESMFTPNENNIIKVDENMVGGHAYLLNEWRIDNYIGIQNSWGAAWGKNGKAYIYAEDFEKLFKYDGEALAAVELEPSTISKNKGCLFSLFHR